MTRGCVCLLLASWFWVGCGQDDADEQGGASDAASDQGLGDAAPQAPDAGGDPVDAAVGPDDLGSPPEDSAVQAADAAMDARAAVDGHVEPHACDDAEDFWTQAAQEPDGTFAIRGRLPSTASAFEGSCGGLGGERVYRLETPQAGEILFRFEAAEGAILHARSDCRDVASERRCGGQAFRDQVLRVAAGDALHFIVDGSLEAADTEFTIWARFAPYVELGAPCDPFRLETRCRPDADCSPQGTCRTAFRHYAPEDCGMAIVSPFAGEEGHWAASRATPPSWPYRVDGVRVTVIPTVSTTPFRVEIYTGSGVAPPAEPVVLAAFDFPGVEPGVVPNRAVPYQFATFPIEVRLEEPVVLREDEHLFVAVQLGGTYPDTNSIGACSFGPPAAELDRYYWSNAVAPPYNWATLASFGLTGELPLDVFGAPLGGDPGDPLGPDASLCEVACRRAAECLADAPCACLDEDGGERALAICRAGCDPALTSAVLDSADCDGALVAITEQSRRFRMACHGVDESCEAPRFQSLSAGGAHTCGLRDDGRALCWGAEGTPPLNPQHRALSYAQALIDFGQADAPAGVFTQLSAGRLHTCGLRMDGTVECWGTNRFGEGTPPAGRFVRLSAGHNVTCGLREDGQIECWGLYSAMFLPGGAFVDLSVHTDGGCARRPNDTVVCWPGPEAGSNFALPSPAGRFSQIDTLGGPVLPGHGCGINEDGVAECWLSEAFRMGAGNAFGQWVPPAGVFSEVVVGFQHTCGLRPDGTVECWGLGFEAPPEGAFTSLSSSTFHTCGRRPDGTVECWGADLYGQASPPGH